MHGEDRAGRDFEIPKTQARGFQENHVHDMVAVTQVMVKRKCGPVTNFAFLQSGTYVGHYFGRAARRSFASSIGIACWRLAPAERSNSSESGNVCRYDPAKRVEQVSLAHDRCSTHAAMIGGCHRTLLHLEHSHEGYP